MEKQRDYGLSLVSKEFLLTLFINASSYLSVGELKLIIQRNISVKQEFERIDMFML